MQRDVVIVQLTDTHIYADPGGMLGGVDTRSSCTRVISRLVADGVAPDALLLTGDLAAEAEPAAYDWLAHALDRIPGSRFCLAGNHDDAQCLADAAPALSWHYGGAHSVGAWRIILLNSAVGGADYGELGARELARLEQSLAAFPAQPTLVVLHHHPEPVASAWMDTMVLRDAPAFWSVIDAHHQVRAVLCGHVHQNYDRYRNRVRVLASPSTCVQFAARAVRFALDPLGPGYRRIELRADGTLATDVVRV